MQQIYDICTLAISILQKGKLNQERLVLAWVYEVTGLALNLWTLRLSTLYRLLPSHHLTQVSAPAQSSDSPSNMKSILEKTEPKRSQEEVLYNWWTLCSLLKQYWKSPCCLFSWFPIFFFCKFSSVPVLMLPGPSSSLNSPCAGYPPSILSVHLVTIWGP